MKKVICMLLAFVMLFSLVACGTAEAPKTEAPAAAPAEATPAEATPAEEAVDISGAKIEFATRLADPALTNLKQTLKNFEAETGVIVELTEYPSADYEAALKTRMAANELPDIFETHGWSRLRYGEYLYPVNDEPWYADQSDLAKGILQGEGDTAYALMLTASVLGVCCNQTAAEECGVDIYSINTYDDLEAAAKTIIDAGKVPFVTIRTAGDFTQWAGQWTSYSDAVSNDSAAQLDGTYDFESFRPMLKYMQNLLNMGAFWPDITTTTGEDVVNRLAGGKSVFRFANEASALNACNEVNSDNTYALIPFPSMGENASRYFAGGEGYAVGIWNETKELEAAKALLSYLAVHGGEFAEGISAISTIESADTLTSKLSIEAMEKFPEAVYVNMWDREYMPSGMWGVFGDAVNQFFNDYSDENIDTILAFLKTNYDEKYLAAQG